MVDFELGPQAAVEAPRWLFGRTWGEPTKALRLESRFDETVAGRLRERGHQVQVVEPWSDLMGHAQVIAVDADGLRAGSDPAPTARRKAGDDYVPVAVGCLQGLVLRGPGPDPRRADPRLCDSGRAHQARAGVRVGRALE
jgi:hypothetical protein